MSDKMKLHPGKTYNTYSDDEVVWLRDEDHTPYNKRVGEVDSVLNVEVRAPSHAKWIGFRVEETTTTKNYGNKPDRTASRTISFNIPREMFDAIAAHVRREDKK
jgi:hypothetical protein